MAAYVFLDEERARLRQEWQRHVTLGEARREVQRQHRRQLIDWLFDQFQADATPDDLYQRFAA